MSAGLYLVGFVLLLIAFALTLNAAMNEAPMWTPLAVTILAVLSFALALSC